MTTIGIVANPASGKDVRRLVARASVFDNQEKQAIVRRVLAGIESTVTDGCRIAYLNDAHGIVRGALEEFDAACTGISLKQAAVAVNDAVSGSAQDTTRAGQALAAAGAAVIVTLGGDGTNRALAKGWQQAPLIPISTGTNNVFPVLIEATVAGAAAGLIASGAIPIKTVSTVRKIITVEVADEPPDIALIDAVFLDERFVGSRALLNPASLRSALLTVADPAAVGITAIGGLLEPLADEVDHGMLLTFAYGTDTPAPQSAGAPVRTVVRAPIAPGYYRQIEISAHARISFSQSVSCVGPGVLAFDGERERVLKPGQRARLTISRDGPTVVDVPLTLRLAARRGCFRTQTGDPNAH